LYLIFTGIGTDREYMGLELGLGGTLGILEILQIYRSGDKGNGRIVE
jgi:hypothetical protein